MTKEFSFDETLAKIETINNWFEGNDYKLDSALEKYNEASALIADCKKHLEKVDNEFKKIEVEDVSENKPETEIPF